jgi:hypothetical protein
LVQPDPVRNLSRFAVYNNRYHGSILNVYRRAFLISPRLRSF